MRIEHIKSMNEKHAITIRLSNSPAQYHLIEVTSTTSCVRAILQISHDCPKEIVCLLACNIKGLGV